MDNKFSYAQKYNATILRNIRIKCAERETSIPKIEKALGYGNGSISGWSKAKRLAPMDRIEAVARLLGCRVSDLTTEKEIKSPAPKEGEAERAEFIRLYEAAPDWLQDQVRSLLKAAESGRAVPDDGPTDR